MWERSCPVYWCVLCLSVSPHTPTVSSVRHNDSRSSLISTDSVNGLSERSIEKPHPLDKVLLAWSNCHFCVHYLWWTVIIFYVYVPLCVRVRAWADVRVGVGANLWLCVSCCRCVQRESFTRRHSASILRFFTDSEETPLSALLKRQTMDFSLLSTPSEQHTHPTQVLH